MGKTPEYVKKAVANYRQNYDFIQIRFPKGTRELLEKKGNINEYICNLVLADLNTEKKMEEK